MLFKYQNLNDIETNLYTSDVYGNHDKLREREVRGRASDAAFHSAASETPIVTEPIVQLHHQVIGEMDASLFTAGTAPSQSCAPLSTKC